jgi:hypothetical protein
MTDTTAKIREALLDGKQCYLAVCIYNDLPTERAQKFDEALALLDAERPSGWISVDDRLPDDEQKCFVHTKYGDASVAVYLVAKSGAYFCPDVDALEQKVGWERDDWRSVGEVRFEGPISHWMPLPSPPDVKE